MKMNAKKIPSFWWKICKMIKTCVTSNLCKRQTTWPKWLKFLYKKCQSILFKTWSISNPCLLASESKSLTESDNSGGWPCIVACPQLKQLKKKKRTTVRIDTVYRSMKTYTVIRSKRNIQNLYIKCSAFTNTYKTRARLSDLEWLKKT